MQLSYRFTVEFRDMLRGQPLAPDEVRKIPKMDDWYVALVGTELDPEECKEMFRVRIDDVPVIVYKCINNPQAGSA